jgi:hypothetical protein
MGLDEPAQRDVDGRHSGESGEPSLALAVTRQREVGQSMGDRFQRSPGTARIARIGTERVCGLDRDARCPLESILLIVRL